MTKTATFSTGFTDTYKGKRDVRAAWMVILPSGKIESGHSATLQNAQKTARQKAADCSGEYVFNPRRNTAASLAYLEKKAREHGYKNHRAMVTATAIKREAYVAACKIEVVAL